MCVPKAAAQICTQLSGAQLSGGLSGVLAILTVGWVF